MVLCIAAPAQTVSVCGNVSDLRGSPLEGVSIESQSHAVSSTKTGRDGRYCLELPTGEQILVAKLPGFYAEHQTIQLAGSESQILNFGLVIGGMFPLKPLRLTGRIVLENGQGVSNAEIIVSNLYNTRIASSTRSRHGGSFAIFPPDAGRFRILAQGPDIETVSRIIELPAQADNVILKARKSR